MVKQPAGGGGGPRKSSANQSANAYERLKQAIMSGELGPGDPLVEIPLSEWLEVSRTPIREALRRLEQDGLAERGARGLVVRNNTPEEIMDLYESRIVLESMASSVAAQRRTAYDLIAIGRALQHYQKATPREMDRLVEYNREFHRAIWIASHNRSLVDMLERLDLHLGRYPATTLTFPGRFEVTRVEHQAIVQAITDRDADLAAELTRSHFIAARDIRLKLWEEE